MPAVVPRPDREPWCDVDGTHLALFCSVEQVEEAPEAGVLSSRMGERGEVVGQGRESLFVRFPDHTVLSVPPRVLRLLPDTTAGGC